VTEQVLEKAVAPFGRRRSPGDSRPLVIASAPLPFQICFSSRSLLLKTRRLGFGTNVRRRSSAVSFAKCMTAGDERDGFLVVHRHAAERFADVFDRENRIGITVRPFRVT